jgi:hypothetical protein
MKTLSLLVLTIGLFFLSGCITIIEKYTIHANGSGTMEYQIDMSKMYETMASFSDSTGAVEAPEIDQSMRDAIPGLEAIKGISNVEQTGDITRYVAGIKFDFTDAKALNQAMAVLFKGKESTTADAKYVDIKGKTFTRFALTSEEFNKESLLGSEELDAETMKMVLESMQYKLFVNFDKPVKKVTTKATYIKEDKSVSIETNFSEMFDKKDLLQTIIKTK